MAKKKKKGSISKSKMISKMAGKYQAKVAEDVSFKGKQRDETYMDHRGGKLKLTLAQANSNADRRGSDHFKYDGKVYKTEPVSRVKGVPTRTPQARKMTV
jgi:hypothetical protein